MWEYYNTRVLKTVSCNVSEVKGIRFLENYGKLIIVV